MNSNSQSQNTIPVSCSECQNEFIISNLKTESVVIDQSQKNVEHTYFTCPSCDHKFTCYYTDEHIREMQMSIQRLYELQVINPATYAKQLVNLQQQLEQAMTALRQVVEDK